MTHDSGRGPFWGTVDRRERAHIVASFRFALAKCDDPEIRRDVVALLAHVDRGLAARAEAAAPPSAPCPAGRIRSSGTGIGAG